MVRPDADQRERNRKEFYGLVTPSSLGMGYGVHHMETLRGSPGVCCRADRGKAAVGRNLIVVFGGRNGRGRVNRFRVG